MPRPSRQIGASVLVGHAVGGEQIDLPGCGDGTYWITVGGTVRNAPANGKRSSEG
jgi:hypothetical protein